MIIELLYPKEMKDAVKKLRVENDLNEEALKNFHYQIIIRIAVCLIIAAILIGIENSYISWTISILLIFQFLCHMLQLSLCLQACFF